MNTAVKIKRHVTLPVWAIFALSLATFYAITSKNPIETLGAFVVLPVFFRLLWHKNEPTILLFVVIWQWFVVTIKVFYSNYLDKTLVEDFGDPIILKAYWASLFGLVVISVAVRITMTGMKLPNVKKIKSQAMQLSSLRLFVLYSGYVASLTLFAKFLPYSMGTILVAIDDLRYALVFVVTYVVFTRRSGWNYFIAMVVVEIVMGLSGFFADFKTVFFVVLITLVTLNYRIKPKMFLVIVAFSLLAFYLGVMWTVVKNEYRSYINAGTGAHAAIVGYKDRLRFMKDMFLNVEQEDFSKGVDHLIRRVEYINYIAYTMKNVPQAIPHENGKLWGNAILHLFMPRILFPDKKALESDTILTMKYTGLTSMVGTGMRTTSISIGYFGDAYIDFGIPGMYVILVIFGFCIGGVYRFFISSSKNILFGYGIAVAVLLSASSFGHVVTKIVGGVVMGFIVGSIALKFVVPNILPHLKLRLTKNMMTQSRSIQNSSVDSDNNS